MSLNNQCLNRIQQLTNKVKTINIQHKPNIHQLRVDREAKRWKDAITKHDKMLIDNSQRVNQIVQMRDERQIQPDDLNYLKERVVSELYKIDGVRRNNQTKINNIKKVQLNNRFDQIIKGSEFVQFDEFSKRLEIISTESSSIHQLLLDSINNQFDKLQNKIEQEQYQEESRNQQLLQCITALDKQFSISLQFQQKQLVSSFEEHHHTLERLLEEITMTLQY